jgi:DNA-binding transcriptional regulator PaaX
MKKTLFQKHNSLAELIILIVATPIALSSPYGSRRITKEFMKYLEDKIPTEELEGIQSGKVSKALYNLRKRKIIDVSKKNGIINIKLTEKGKKRRISADLNKLGIRMPDNWDGKWRMLMFDIPENKKVARESLRDRLKQLKFFQFQKSVWIHPYDCRKEIDFIADVFGVGEYITLLVVKIDDDVPLKEHFRLD